jgi:hypothetical protein
MTMTVGLVGIDGVVLAADKEKRKLGERPVDLHDVSSIKKIVNRPDLGLAYALAGDELILRIGKDLETSLETKTFDLSNVLASLTTLSKRIDYVIGSQVNSPRSLLMAFYGPNQPIQLWYMEYWSDKHSLVERVDGKQISGAMANSARFVLDAYFRYDRPVEELKLLAAHVILSGYKVDRYINGLDVAVITKDGYREMTAQERESVRAHSAEIDRLIFEP